MKNACILVSTSKAGIVRPTCNRAAKSLSELADVFRADLHGLSTAAPASSKGRFLRSWAGTAAFVDTFFLGIASRVLIA